MKILHSLWIAFGMYSRIPVPATEWRQENMKYSLCFFPLIGAVTGGIIFGLYLLGTAFKVPNSLMTVMYIAVPILVNGGIHMDGLMDTMDALASHKAPEEKRRILKDSHAGAFAVLGCSLYLLVSYGAFAAVAETSGFPLGILLGYTISRALSGFSVVTFPKAPSSSFVMAFADSAARKVVQVTMGIYLAVCFGVLLYQEIWLAIVIMVAMAVLYWHYYRMSVKQFEGITGDLAGYFLQIAELVILCICTVYQTFPL